MPNSELRAAEKEYSEQMPFDFAKLRDESRDELICRLRFLQDELLSQNEELRKTKLELEKSHDRFNTRFEFAPVGYVTLDDSGCIVEANLTIAGMLDVERETLIGTSLRHFVAPGRTMQFHRHLENGQLTSAKLSCEMVLKRSDDSDLLVRLDSITAADGTRSIAIIDMTYKAGLIRGRLESDEKLRAICGAIPVPIACVDTAGVYQFNNHTHEQWFGVSGADIVGLHMSRIAGGDIFKAAEPSLDSAFSGRRQSFCLEVHCTDDVRRTVDVHYAPWRDSEDQVVGLYEFMFDISTDANVKARAVRREGLEAELQKLSTRQQSILGLLLHGKSNKLIALDLEVGIRTVERDRHEIQRTLDVDSVNELLVKFADFVAPEASSHG